MILYNVFYHYLGQYHYLGHPGSKFADSTTTTATATTSLIYYVMCLEARFYDYLAPNDVKIK
jgi:hypothetical protein